MSVPHSPPRSPEERSSKRVKAEDPQVTDAPFADGRTVSHIRTADAEGIREVQDNWGAAMEWNEDEAYEDEDEDDTVNREIVDTLASLYREAPIQASGILPGPFKLTVTREGCKLSVNVVPQPGAHAYAQRPQERVLIEKLFKHASPSPYGDVRSQTTRHDMTVRNARELSSSEFSVEPALLDTVRDCWAGAGFHPRAVRVEPYKTHLYGEGGHFKSHRDTPELGLVGTFLLGLGDSTYSKNFKVDGKKYSAHAGEWVAFYPDLAHEVELLRNGHRGVIAFKIFRDESMVQPEDVMEDATFVRCVDEAVKEMRPPFALLMQRKYCMGTMKLSGFEVVLHSCFSKIEGVEVHLLPVVIRWWWDQEEEDGQVETESKVYSCTSQHVDALVKWQSGASSNWAGALRDPLDRTPGIEWLKNLYDINFYAVDMKQTTMEWSQNVEESDYTGNQSRMQSGDSVYLSHALVVVPALETPSSDTTSA